jgi:hypothetical protein
VRVRSGPPGPRSLSDRELRIKRAAPPQDGVSPGEVPPQQRPRVEGPSQEEISPAAGDSQKAAEVPVQDEVSMAAEVTEGDSQKADNASVPDHLWLRACTIGYGDEACTERHREALSLPTGDVGALGISEPPAG